MDAYNVPKYFSYNDQTEGWNTEGVYGNAQGASVSDKGKIQNVLTVVTLPSTGGSGTKMIYAVEIALAAVAGFLFVLRRRLKNAGTA